MLLTADTAQIVMRELCQLAEAGEAIRREDLDKFLALLPRYTERLEGLVILLSGMVGEAKARDIDRWCQDALATFDRGDGGENE